MYRGECVKHNIFCMPVEILEKRLENATFPYKIVLRPPWELHVSKTPIAVAERLSFSTVKLIPSKNILLTAETSGQFTMNKKGINGVVISPKSIECAQKKVASAKDLIEFANANPDCLSKTGFFKASSAPLLWLNYEATFPPSFSNVFHTHITKGKPKEAVTPSNQDIINVWSTLSPNQETLLFVIPHENIDQQLISASKDSLKSEDELIYDAANRSFLQRVESDLPFFVIKVRRNKTNEIELHVPSKVIFHVED